MIDTRAGNYRLVERLGAGGMGEVYKAVHDTIEARVAIKILHASAVGDRDAEQRFIREAQAVNRIDHAGVVKVLDAGRLGDGRPYLVMELLDGRALSDVIKTTRLSVLDACRIVADVLDALAAAHAVGIIHRDLKPANIFRTTSGRTVVLDFGIAKIMDGAARLTAGNVAIGTPHYMAPEQIREGGVVGPPCDVYAAGLVLFELLCGRRPFDSADAGDVMLAHLERRPPPPRAIEPAIPTTISDLVLAALAKDPERRPRNAAAMRDALRDAIDSPSMAGAGRLPATPPALAAASAPPPTAATVRHAPQRPSQADTLARETVVEHRAPRSRWPWLALVGGALVIGALAIVAGGSPGSSRASAPVVAPTTPAPDATTPRADADSAPPDPCLRLEPLEVLVVPADLVAATSAIFLGLCVRDAWPSPIVACVERSAGVNAEVERCLMKLPAPAHARIAAAIRELATTQRTTVVRTSRARPGERSAARPAGKAADPPVVPGAPLTITSAPAGARLAIDGLPVGVTPWTGTLAPRTVAIELSAPGHLTARRDATLKPAAKTTLHVVLAADPRDAIQLLPFDALE